MGVTLGVATTADRCQGQSLREASTLLPSGDQSQRRELRSKLCWCPVNTFMQRFCGAYGRISQALIVLSCTSATLRQHVQAERAMLPLPYEAQRASHMEERQQSVRLPQACSFYLRRGSTLTLAKDCPSFMLAQRCLGRSFFWILPIQMAKITTRSS